MINFSSFYSVLPDGLEVLLLIPVKVPCYTLQDALQRGEDQRQMRSQLVGDVAEELALQPINLPEFIVCLFE